MSKQLTERDQHKRVPATKMDDTSGNAFDPTIGEVSKTSRDCHGSGKESMKTRYDAHRCSPWHTNDVCGACSWSRHRYQLVKNKEHSGRVAEDDTSSKKLSSSASGMLGERTCAEGTEARRNRAGTTAGCDCSDDDEAEAQTNDSVQTPCLEKNLNVQLEKLNDVLARLATQGSGEPAQGTAIGLPDRKAIKFQRLDRVYDEQLRAWKFVEREVDDHKDSAIVFRVRREYDMHGKLERTRVDIHTELLRTTLNHIFRSCSYNAMIEGVYDVDPCLLFHFRADISAYIRSLRERKAKSERKAHDEGVLLDQVAQCELLLEFIIEDFFGDEERLDAMVSRGVISFDLVWALFKPGTIAYTSTYQNEDDPRCFKVETAQEHDDCVLDGKYLQCDGERFSMAHYRVVIQAFEGCKKITDLAAYPLQYHKDSQGTRRTLIERGRKFVSLLGVWHCSHKGAAYMKNDDETIRLNCDSRIMVDPVTFRRVNPNYLHSHPHWGHKDYDYEIGSSAHIAKRDGAKNKEPRTYAPPELIGEHAENQCPGLEESRWPCRAAGNADCGVARVSANKGTHFTEEELLIASPVVLGFELTEKCWLEFSLAGLHEIQWNADAMRSVIMPDCTKRNLDALISNHSSDAVSRPANVVGLEEQGLNVVLHGPSGVGKTMTGVAIAEHLRRPLYTMNTDELGISASSVAQSLGEIVENVRSWGAVLLLDAADIYLESRQAHDIHHNSVVSVLLRFLERHNSILIMTTDRLESFDRAIQSHIHMGIRFENPSAQMRKTMWRQQVLEAQQGVSTRPRDKESVKSLSEEDFDHLSKRALDGRQITNVVQASRNMALFDGTALARKHIEQALEMASSFEDDMRGGKGFRDAMRQYT